MRTRLPQVPEASSLQARSEDALSSMALSMGKSLPKEEKTAVQRFLFPDEEELPDNLELPIWDHLEVGSGAAARMCFKNWNGNPRFRVACQGVEWHHILNAQCSPHCHLRIKRKACRFACVLTHLPGNVLKTVLYNLPRQRMHS